MNSLNKARKTLLAVGVGLLLTAGVAACGSDDGSDSTASGTIERNDANSDVSLTIGSKNFTEQIVLGEIYDPMSA